MASIRSILFPVVDDEAQKIIDKESIANIYRLSLAGMVLMLVALVLFIPSMGQFDQTTWVRIGKFVSGFFICLAVFAINGRILKSDRVSHRTITALVVAYVLALSLWAVFVSYREYVRGEQLLIFFSIELLIVCFVPLRPLTSALLTIGIYSCLYAIAFSIDGAQGLIMRNLIVIVVVTITGMIVNYHFQVRLSNRTMHLKRANDQLEFSNHHDALTGLHNRLALQEDVAKALGSWVSVRMMDVNGFKQINDTYGHLVGDSVLTEAGRQIEEHFPKARCYRYGGDEFLVVYGNSSDVNSGNGGNGSENELRFQFPPIQNEEVALSIGYTEGTPQTDEEFFKLVAEADANLYEVKRLRKKKRETV